jgi:hypothetical protein
LGIVEKLSEVDEVGELNANEIRVIIQKQQLPQATHTSHHRKETINF